MITFNNLSTLMMCYVGFSRFTLYVTILACRYIQTLAVSLYCDKEISKKYIATVGPVLIARI